MDVLAWPNLFGKVDIRFIKNKVLQPTLDLECLVSILINRNNKEKKINSILERGNMKPCIGNAELLDTTSSPTDLLATLDFIFQLF